MLKLSNIQALTDMMASGSDLEQYGFAYVDRERWRTEPENTPLFLTHDDDSEDFDEQAGMPVVAAQLGLRSLLSIADLEGVVSNFRKACPNGTTAELIDAI